MTAPAAEARLFRSRLGAHIFIADGSRIYDLGEEEEAAIASGLEAGDEAVLAPFADGPRRIAPAPPPLPRLRALSLAVAQACNMGCGYCYADEGRFGGRARLMSAETARRAVDLLLEQAGPGEAVMLGYMGGEPLLNRGVVHATTEYAARAAAARGSRVRFGLTTNATLITPEDARLFAAHGFTVSVSMDGTAAQHDRQRKMRDGRGSHARALRGLATLMEHGPPRHLAARVTATPGLDLAEALDHLAGLGFDSVGFAAALTSADPRLRLEGESLRRYGEQLIALGEAALACLKAGRRSAFGNLGTALAELHRGTHRPYPCGAGAAYLGAGADGRLAACHRLVDAPGFGMGDLDRGPDDARRAALLARSHVDRIEPCRSCWARYLCGGGCHHEVAAAGRPGCDVIRAWLEFCLRAYAELSDANPAYFRRDHNEAIPP